MKLKQVNLITNNDVKNVLQRPNKNREKIEKLQTFAFSYFLGKNVFGDDGFQNLLKKICIIFQFIFLLVNLAY